MKKKTALIFGISGQDGSYLSHLLLSKGYKVLGVTRNSSKKNLFRLEKLKTINHIKLLKGEASNLNFCKKIINSKIDEIYFLAGYSSSIGSFHNPKKSFNSDLNAILNILDFVQKKKYKVKIFNAGSGQFFGNSKNSLCNIDSKIAPQSPYGVAKASTYWLTKIYRDHFNLFCCTGVLFNHESPLRSNEFVTKKIINISKKIKNNKNIKLKLGNLNIYRDWGWAPEYVEAMWLMLQRNKPIDLIIGSGKLFSLKDFVDEVFDQLGINKKNLVTNVQEFKRKTELVKYKADIKSTIKILKWKPKVGFKKIIYKMIHNELF